MSQLDDALDRIRSHDGVEHVLVLGRDGLLIQHAGGDLDAETVSAMVPGVAQAATALGNAAGSGDAGTVVVRLASGVAIVEALSDDVLLAVLLRSGTGFAALLAELGRSRGELALLV